MSCYLIAKDIHKIGCLALKLRHGAELVALKRELIDVIGLELIELVTISRPSAYGEYEPYTFFEDAEEFKKAVLSLHSTDG
ncbi:DUF6718 family protein [Butyrivibrio sp. WCE2006]|uniref:DUF6718 family protein n=1 Tax=Butyrivibrio sp. WCE2006 TaxID=1410611 RepID=UPI0005D27292|nr:DUF6718 family protein [Butyrivibrio sp. WCE2006]